MHSVRFVSARREGGCTRGGDVMGEYTQRAWAEGECTRLGDGGQGIAEDRLVPVLEVEQQVRLLDLRWVKDG